MNHSQTKFFEPQAPDHQFIELLHRGNDGFVSLHSKDDTTDDFEDLAAIRATCLQREFPRLAPSLINSSFFSINSFYRAFGKSTVLEDSPKHSRRADCLRWLTAVYSDLDVGRDGTPTVGQTIGALIDYQDAGLIPSFSAMVRSGRGLWVYWFLENDDPKLPTSGPVRAWPRNVSTYSAIQNELFKRLALLHADRQSLDTCRITRIPGSIHPRTQQRVSYLVSFDKSGHIPSYTLRGLCDFLGIEYCERTGRAQPTKRYPNRRNSWVAMHEKRLQLLLLLERLRDGFKKGCRNRAAFLLAQVLKALGKPKDLIESSLSELGENCSPRLSKSELKSAMQTRHLFKFSNQTIADYLLVTSEESKCLTCGWPPATRFGRPVPRVSERESRRSEHQEKRREHILGIVNHQREVPSVRKLMNLLDDQGIEVSKSTVHEDLRALRTRTGKIGFQAGTNR